MVTGSLLRVERIHGVSVEANARELGIVTVLQALPDVAVNPEPHLVASLAAHDKPLVLRPLTLHPDDDQRNLVALPLLGVGFPEEGGHAVGALLQVELPCG